MREGRSRGGGEGEIEGEETRDVFLVAIEIFSSGQIKLREVRHP